MAEHQLGNHMWYVQAQEQGAETGSSFKEQRPKLITVYEKQTQQMGYHQ